MIFAAAADEWHVARLVAALSRRGVGAVTMSLECCAFDTSAPFGLRLDAPGELPDGAIVKNISAGSFEAVTRRLGILHALRALHVPVWNDAIAIERCVDKSMTTFLLRRAGLPVPHTWAVEGLDAARGIVEREVAAGPLVLKPLFGSQGRGLALIRSADDLPPPEPLGNVYYLQRFVGGAGPEHRDFRVFVIDGEAVAAMVRRGTSWITNVKQGGTPMAVDIDPELEHLSVAAADAVGAAYCGVDILRAPDGAPFVLEVNSMPAWSGLQKVVAVDIAGVLAARFCESLRTRVSDRVVA
jgi:tetrahydromethanopterin:alpha-L-glutamate ligase